MLQNHPPCHSREVPSLLHKLQSRDLPHRTNCTYSTTPSCSENVLAAEFLIWSQLRLLFGQVSRSSRQSVFGSYICQGRVATLSAVPTTKIPSRPFRAAMRMPISVALGKTSAARCWSQRQSWPCPRHCLPTTMRSTSATVSS